MQYVDIATGLRINLLRRKDFFGSMVNRALTMLIFLFPMGNYAHNDSVVEERLMDIPQHERTEIEDYFKSLLISGDFAFTLFGAKPMSGDDHCLTLAFQTLNKRYRRAALIELRGMRTWEKYAHLFPFKRYRLMTYDSIDDNACFGTELVNVEKCRNIIDEHRDLFEKVYGEKVSLEQILAQLGNGANCSQDRISYFEGLGVLFGYPQQAIEEFKTRSQLYDTLATLPLNLEGYDAKFIMQMARNSNRQPLVDASQALKKLSALEPSYSYTRYFKPNLLFPIRVPGYMSSVQGDTLQYEAVIPQIMSLYNSSTFLEEILTILLS